MSYRSGRSAAPLIALALSSFASLSAQDRLKTMPGYERYQKMSAEIPRLVTLGALPVDWTPGGSSFEYARGGRLHRFDVGHSGVNQQRLLEFFVENLIINHAIATGSR